MAECLITSGWEAEGCDVRFNTPGVERDEIYLFNKSDITAFVSSVPGEISNLTLEVAAVGFMVAGVKNSVSWTEDLQADISGNFYNQEFVMKIIDESTATRQAIEGLVNVDLVVVFKQKNGKYYILGTTEGLRLTGDNNVSGAAPGDEHGDTLTLTGVENNKALQFFDTDEATTAANIAALL